MKVTRIIGEVYDANVFVLEKEDECLIIDSGASLEKVKNIVKNKKIQGVLLTHGHYDHSLYCNEYAKEFNCSIYAHKDITKTMKDKKANYSEEFIFDDFSKFVFINEDKKIKLGCFEIECFYCPGHSICCEVYKIKNELFSGDVLFARGVGRTDLVNSDKEQMFNSLCKLENIKFNTVHSGHDDDSTYEWQQKNIKIFKRFLAR